MSKLAARLTSSVAFVWVFCTACYSQGASQPTQAESEIRDIKKRLEELERAVQKTSSDLKRELGSDLRGSPDDCPAGHSRSGGSAPAQDQQPQGSNANPVRYLPVEDIGEPAPLESSLAGLEGFWNNDLSRENITVRQNNDLEDNRMGQGRWSETSDWGANLVIEYRGQTCWYYVTFTDNGNLMNWAIRNTMPGSVPTSCVSGVFHRATGPNHPS
jgi:hypothetical protein